MIALLTKMDFAWGRTELRPVQHFPDLHRVAKPQSLKRSFMSSAEKQQ